MPPTDPTASYETPRDFVEIRAENEITIPLALQLAKDASLSIGLSTLQRWAKKWQEQGSSSRVKAILASNRDGRFYKIDREDFLAWVFDQKQNVKPHEDSKDIEKSPETSKDLPKSHETSRDASQMVGDDALKKLERENMSLKIDVEVRNQLLEQAKSALAEERARSDNQLREMGSLQHQLLHLKGHH